jgi:hypothetical protein
MMFGLRDYGASRATQQHTLEGVTERLSSAFMSDMPGVARAAIKDLQSRYPDQFVQAYLDVTARSKLLTLSEEWWDVNKTITAAMVSDDGFFTASVRQADHMFEFVVTYMKLAMKPASFHRYIKCVLSDRTLLFEVKESTRTWGLHDAEGLKVRFSDACCDAASEYLALAMGRQRERIPFLRSHHEFNPDTRNWLITAIRDHVREPEMSDADRYQRLARLVGTL